MFCSICNSEMLRDDNDLGQWKCKKCGHEGLCRKCGMNPVHPHRKWQLCLDCICNMLEEDGRILMQTKWKEIRNDWKSNKAIRIKNERNKHKNEGDE